ncbi:MAG: DUF167 domain-containing protein, partial [Candidatus Rokuibacteriota bacterium]
MPARAISPGGGLRPPANLQVRVQARARRNEVVAQADGVLRVRVTAAPEGGEANRVVIAVLAEALGVAPSRIVLP